MEDIEKLLLKSFMLYAKRCVIGALFNGKTHWNDYIEYQGDSLEEN